MKKLIIMTLVICFILFGTAVIYTFYVIHGQVEKITTTAKVNFRKNAIESLTALIDSENFSYPDKNAAIWALGQYADAEALQFLEKINAATEDQDYCNRERELCKKEIERAIKWCRKGNVTSWMYKRMKN
jgi:HEAT repeat protein